MKTVFVLLFMCAGIGLVIFGGRLLNIAQESESWPVVEGQITKSEVERKRGTGSNHNKVTYHFRIEYIYNVNGLAYTGDRVAIGDYGTGKPDHAQEIVNQYPLGKKVNVHYEAENPGNALLETGVTPKAFVIPGLGFIFFAAAVFMQFAFKKKAA